MTNAERAAFVLAESLTAIGGCGNHGCPISRPGGMRTNGPCRCLEDRDKRVRVGHALTEFRRAYAWVDPKT